MNRVPVIIEAICYLLVKLKRADKIHLVKLMYLADKYHLMYYGRTVTGDNFVALEHGPAGSRTMDVLEFDGYVLGNHLNQAKRLFKKGDGHEYLPGGKCPTDQLEMLSDSDIEALDFATNNFGRMNKWDVVDYTHTLPEWKKFEKLFKNNKTRQESIAAKEVLLNPNDRYFSIPKEHIEESCKILTGAFD